MKPYYEDSAVTIYHGDCKMILPEITADAVVTDPPWNMGFFNDDNKKWSEYETWLKEVLFMCEKFAGQVWFLSTKSIPFVSHLFKDYIPFASIKNFSQMTPKKLPNCWDIAFVKSSGYLGNGRNWYLCNTAGMLKDRTGHPTPRTIDVMLYLISLHSWKIIVDPFAGSGTTLRAAKDLNRKAIGIEIEEKYCEIAANRMCQEVLEL